MAHSYPVSFPNLSDPRYAPEEGLFAVHEGEKSPMDPTSCIANFNQIVGQRGYRQVPFFISKADWKQILNPMNIFPGQFPKGSETLYAIAFCYCIGDGKPEHDFAYLRLRLIFAKPTKPKPLGSGLGIGHQLDLSYPDLPAHVYTSPIGRTTKAASGISAFQWLVDSGSVLEVGQDVDRWSGRFHDTYFPKTEPLAKPPTYQYYEGNIVGKKRLQDIFDREVIKGKKDGITIQFAYDDLRKKIFLVFSINPTYTTLGVDDPLKCPPHPTNVCAPANFAE